MQKKNLAIGIGGLAMCGILALAMNGGEDDAGTTAVATAAPDAVADVQPTDLPAKAVEPVDTEAPTEVPTEAPTEAPPEPIHVEGIGQTATDALPIPFAAAVASFTHNGSSNFAVKAITADGDEDLLVNEIGAYSGRVLVASPETITFDIDADGMWTLDIVPAGEAAEAAFSGKGDDVSGLFDPPASGAWEFSHDGTSNFAVILVCQDGQDLIQNEIGAVGGSGVVKFGDGPCLWSVNADGNWSLTPR